MMVDCAVIGGGLAGLASAILLAEQNYSVILFEKKKYPFHKVCGEYIGLESYTFLQELGLNLDALKLPHLDKLLISAPGGHTLKQRLEPGGFGISRFTLDYLLMQRAQTLKVEVRENTTVKNVEGKAGNFKLKLRSGFVEARTVIGSFGKHSQLDSALKRRHKNTQTRFNSPYIGVKYHVQADFPADRIELHNFKNGYCGISRVEGDRTCLCYLTTVANLKASEGRIEVLEERFLKRNPYLNRYLSDFPKLYAAPLSISNIYFKPKKLVENNIFMAGDAAGLITPLCGNGMSMALHAAAMLAGFLPAYLDGQLSFKNCKQHYQRAWQKTFSIRLQAGRYFQRLFGSEIMTDYVIQLLAKSNLITQNLIRLTHGKSFSKLDYRRLGRTFQN